MNLYQKYNNCRIANTMRLQINLKDYYDWKSQIIPCKYECMENST